jgi:cytochrome c-type biogenesis protein CcmH/NrfG
MRSEKEDVAAVREAVRARPADYRGWLILGQMAPAGEREAVLRKAVEIKR